MLEIYTIGYSGFSVEEFLRVLIDKKITCLIDVRSSPYSKFYSQFDEDSIKKILYENKIIYRNYKKEFGARQTNRVYYSSDGYLDFDKFTNSTEFKDGCDKLLSGIEKGYTFCLMCAEKDPISCHRSIMIGKALKKIGFNVKHIMPENIIINQQELENKLLNTYFSDRFQTSLFGENKSDDELIQEAYLKKNREIGFRKDDE